MSNLTPEGKSALNALAINLQVPPGWLYNLMKFETAGTFNPQIKNPNSSARGMIQFIDKTARSLGYRDSLDLVNKHPTQESQILGPVYQYLKQFKPFLNEQSLYMSVFYPAARQWPGNKEFPDHVQKVNPGIKTPRDYVNMVRRKAGAAGAAITLAFISAVGFIAVKHFKGKR